MPPRPGTASEFVLATLRTHADRELTIADLFELADGKFTKENLRQALDRQAEHGMVTKAAEPDRSVWWGITGLGMKAS
jgi:hypothetical protein